MKIFLKLDPLTIQDPVRASIISRTGTLREVEHNLFVFLFSPVEFTHAQKLLSMHPETYGKDLSIYLSNVITHFDRTDETREITLSFGDTDFKRKMSEDMGVGLAAIFMNKAFGVEWKSMIQVPVNKRLQSKRPDFQGFNSAQELFLFEAKGTTSPLNVEKQISKGKEQIKAYSTQAAGKYVIASYFSGDVSTFPSTTFVIDPPANGTPITNPEKVIALHYVRVLTFMGLNEQAAAYRKLLVLSNKSGSYGYNLRLDVARSDFIKTWEHQPELSEMTHGAKKYAIKTEEVIADGKTFRIDFGLNIEIIKDLKQGSINQDYIRKLESEVSKDVSVFDDGTIFRVDCIED